MASYLSDPFTIRLSTLPAWVPAPGRVAIMPMTVPSTVPAGAVAVGGTMWQVDPCPSDTCPYNVGYNGTGNENVVDAFCGGIAAPDFGTKGALILHGGGHADYGGNETYALDIGRQCFLRLDNPSVTPEMVADINPIVDEFHGELSDGQPASCHSYDNLIVIPAAHGGGAKGTLLRTVSLAMYGGQRTTGFTHAFDLANPSARWSRFTGDRYNENSTGIGTKNGVSGSSCYDSKRGRVWHFDHSHESVIAYIDLATRLWTTFLSVSPGRIANEPERICSIYHALRDIPIVMMQPDSSLSLPWRAYYFDPDNPTGGYIRATLGGDPLPSGRVMGMDYCEANGKFYCLFYNNTGFVYEIDVPADVSAAWTVTRLPFDGDAAAISAMINAQAQNILRYKRFSYQRHIKSFVFLSRARNQPVLVYRPPGT